MATQPATMTQPSDNSRRAARGIGATIAAVFAIVFVKAVLITAASSLLYGAVDPGGVINDNKIVDAANTYTKQIQTPEATLMHKCAGAGLKMGSADCKAAVDFMYDHRAISQQTVAALSHKAENSDVEAYRLAKLEIVKGEGEVFDTLYNAMENSDQQAWTAAMENLKKFAPREDEAKRLAGVMNKSYAGK